MLNTDCNKSYAIFTLKFTKYMKLSPCIVVSTPCLYITNKITKERVSDDTALKCRIMSFNIGVFDINRERFPKKIEENLWKSERKTLTNILYLELLQ